MASLYELKRRLYKKGEEFEERGHAPELVRPASGQATALAETSVQEEGAKSENFFMAKIKSKKSSLIFATLIVLGILAFFYGSGIFDFESVEVKIEGPSEIKSGENIKWSVIVSNRNANDIENTSLVFSIPASPSLGGPDSIRERIELGVIKSGEEREFEFESVIFGGRGTELSARAVLEYKPKDASAFFAKEYLFSFSIAQSPVTVSLEVPSEARAGREIKIFLKYFSQSEFLVSDLYAKAEYPSGFEFKSASPVPSEGNNIWSVGSLEAGQDGTIEIEGVLKETGASAESFKVSIGVKKDDSILSYDEAIAAIVPSSPFLSVDILPQGQEGAYKASLGEEINAVVRWKNNLPESVQDASLEVKIEDDKVDFASVRVRNGSFSAFSKTIIWNSSTYDDFSNIIPGATGVVSFSFKIKNNIVLSSSSPHPKVVLTAVLKPGKPVQGFPGAEVSGEDEVEIPISSKIQFSSRGLYFGSTITNSGSLPPKIGQETTYTINWSLANPLNDIKNTIVKTSLPPYIGFKEIILPSDANLVFDEQTGVLEWRAGVVPAGTGFSRPAMSISFQVGLRPIESQVGTSPILVNDTNVVGIDSYTEEVLSALEREITTDLRGDSQLDFNQRKVVK